jgi:hypothetical protein
MTRRNPRQRSVGATAPREVARLIETNARDVVGFRVRIARKTHLTVWRAIVVVEDPGVDPLDRVDFECLGRAWAAHPGTATGYYNFSSGKGTFVVLKGRVAAADVDWDQTATKAVAHTDELELVLRPHARVRILGASVDAPDTYDESQARRLDIEGSVGPQRGERWASDCQEAFRGRLASRSNPRRRTAVHPGTGRRPRRRA